MVETLVRQLSDGEELVMEASPTGAFSDPRERTLELRRRALDDENAPDDGRS